jgi:hypothetical protein
VSGAKKVEGGVEMAGEKGEESSEVPEVVPN